MIPALSRENILADIFLIRNCLGKVVYAPKTPPGRGWYFFLCCGEALGCKCLCQCFVLLAAEFAVPVNDVAADGESIPGGTCRMQPEKPEGGGGYCRNGACVWRGGH